MMLHAIKRGHKCDLTTASARRRDELAVVRRIMKKKVEVELSQRRGHGNVDVLPWQVSTSLGYGYSISLVWSKVSFGLSSHKASNMSCANIKSCPSIKLTGCSLLPSSVKPISAWDRIMYDCDAFLIRRQRAQAQAPLRHGQNNRDRDSTLARASLKITFVYLAWLGLGSLMMTSTSKSRAKDKELR